MRCKALDECGFKKHCFTTRLGGVSEGHLSQLNLSFSREKRENVLENYRRVAKAVGFSGTFALTDQQHTDIVKKIDKEYDSRGFIMADSAVDGLITDKNGVCLTVFIADCVPVIIADPVKRAVACVHSGWRSTAKKITKNAIEMMSREYGSNPRDLVCAIGPCINLCCYEVGQDVFDSFCMLDANAKSFFKAKADGKYMLDLNSANCAVLEQAGVLKSNIHISYECTFCKSDLYFSHRATKGLRGNLAAMIEI